MTGQIRLVEVSKSYPQPEAPRIVLERASAVFDQGQFIAIRGRSGSGKTTLLNLVAGLDSPNSGQIWIDGTDVAALAEPARTLFRRQQLGMVFQFFNLIPTLTVLENVVLPAELAGTLDDGLRARARQLLEQVDLADRRHEAPDRLSGGEQQRVAIARALIQSPAIVIADEPTGNLDRTTGASVLDLLETVTRAAGRTLLVATHSREIARRADRVVTIHQGQIHDLDLDQLDGE
jgi:putative ABC transport system ATP-binding protein